MKTLRTWIRIISLLNKHFEFERDAVILLSLLRRQHPDEKRGVLLNFPNSQQNPESSWWFFTLSDTAGWHELLLHCLQIMFGLMHPFVLQSYQDMTAWRQKPTNVREGVFPIGECVVRLWFFPIHSLLSSQIPIVP